MPPREKFTQQKAYELKKAAKEARPAVTKEQFGDDIKAKAKALEVGEKEVAAFFEEQEDIERAARRAFKKYDVDESGFIDEAELYTVLQDLQMFEGLDEAASKELVEKTFKSSDTNSDGKLTFGEFAACYNRLKEDLEAAEDASYKAPNIFGDISPEEQARVKAMGPMLDKSIFKARKREAASKDYFDTTALRDKMFKLDWGRIDKKPSFKEWKIKKEFAKIEKDSGKVKNEKVVNAMKKRFRLDYDILCIGFDFYTCRNDSATNHIMGLDQFKEYTFAAGFRDVPDGGKFGFMNITGLFEELNLMEDSKKLKKQNDANPDQMFLRFEFLEAVFHMAFAFAAEGADPVTTLGGFLKYAKSNLERSAKVASTDRNVFRKDRLYTKAVMDTFNAYARELRAIYAIMVGKDFQDATMSEWMWMTKRLGLSDDHLKEPEGVHENELVLIFSLSQMMVPDEIKNRNQYTSMSFTEFLEALARIADAKDLPSKEALEESGCMNAFAAQEESETLVSTRNKPPKIPRDPASSFWEQPPPEAVKPLETRLVSLFDYLFAAMDPECGSVLLGTYDHDKLMASLVVECEALHDKVLWKTA